MKKALIIIGVLGLIAVGVYAIFPDIVDDIIPHPDSILRESCHFTSGPRTGISYTERGQIIEIGCTGPSESFKLEYIRLNGGYLIDVPSGEFFIRVYSLNPLTGLPETMLEETTLYFEDLDLTYSGKDWIPLYFDDFVTLNTGEKYAITWVYPDYFPGVGFMNCHITTIGLTSTYICGDGVFSHPGGSWGFLKHDFMFEVYGFEV